MSDTLKILITLVLYLGLVPAYGVLCAAIPKLVRVNLAILTFMPTIAATKWSFQIESIEWYRGHTRGFETNFLVALAVSSLIGMQLNKNCRVRWIPLAMVPYWLFVIASSLSVINAMEPDYTWMAALKFSAIGFIYVFVYNAISDESELRLIQNTLAVALIWQLLLVLKLKYVDGIYRAKGAFSHSNNLGMYAYMTGLYILGVIQQAKPNMRRFALLASAYIAAVALALVTISRASFAVATMGSALVMGLSLLLRPGLKKILIGLALLVPISIGVYAVSDQLLARTESAEGHGEGSLRGALEQQAAAMLDDEPLGIGWNNFCAANSPPSGDYVEILDDYRETYHGYRRRDGDNTQNPLIENLYWMILAETGYFSLVFFLCFLAVVLSYPLRALLPNRKNELGATPLAFCIILPILYLHGILERILWDTPILVVFMLLAGTNAKVWALTKARAQHPPRTQPQLSTPVASRSMTVHS